MAKPPAAPYPDGPKIPIKAITVEGAAHLPEARVRELLLFRVGSIYDPAVAAQARAALLATDSYEDVRFGWDGTTLMVKAKEHLEVGSLSFTGNTRFSSEQLAAAITLKPGGIITKEAVRGDRDRIAALYAVQGGIGATVEPNITPTRPAGKLVFIIHEGAKPAS